MSPSFPKDGRLESPVYLDFVRRQACYWCAASPPSHAHHWPPKGRGVLDDSRTLPACARCHMRCHGARVDGADPIEALAQRAAVGEVFRRFIMSAPDAEIRQVLRDAARMRASRVYVVPA